MFKRLRWMGIGVALGAGASTWTRRRWRQAAARGRPSQAGTRVVLQAARLVRESLDEGRQVMASREAELRARVEAPAATRASQLRLLRPTPARHPTADR